MKSAVALGSNLGDREAIFSQAEGLITRFVGQITARSKWIETEPLNHPTHANLIQPKYLNGIVLIETSLDPLEILTNLHRIEDLLGRTRTDTGLRWGPREIDLDLICCESLVVDMPNLRLPHPELHKRKFVLTPMNEVYPDWTHPVLKMTASEMLDMLSKRNEQTES